MGGDRDQRRDDGVPKKESREQEEIEDRGHGMGRGRVVSDMVVGVGVVERFIEREAPLEGRPKVRECRSRKRRRSGSEIGFVINKIQIPTKEGRTRSLSREHGFNKTGVVSVVAPRLKVGVEDLKGGPAQGRGIAAKLNAATRTLRQRHIDT